VRGVIYRVLFRLSPREIVSFTLSPSILIRKGEEFRAAEKSEGSRAR